MKMENNESKEGFNLVKLIETLISRNSQKMLTIFVGGFFCWLGYRLFIMGVTGQFDFRGDLTGFTAQLVSGSPGLFFALLGAIIAIVAVRQRTTVETENGKIIKIAKKEMDKIVG